MPERLGEGRGLNGWEEGGAGTVGRREGPEWLGGGRDLCNSCEER